MQQFLKPAVGSAGADVVAAELLGEFLVTVDHAVAAADMGFGRVNPFLRLLVASKAEIDVDVGGMVYLL